MILFQKALCPARSQKGIVMISVIIIMLTIAIIGTSLMELSASVSLSNTRISDEAKALYLAEAGVAAAIGVLKEQLASGGSDQEVGPVKLGEGTYKVKINFNQSLIQSIGEVRGSRKRLQLQYNTL